MKAAYTILVLIVLVAIGLPGYFWLCSIFPHGAC